MSGQGDGSIIVDTDVDASGLEKGLDNLRRSMESLTVTIERIGKKMESAISAYTKSLAGGVGEVRRIQDGVTQTGDSAKDALSEMTAKTEEISAAGDKTAESYGKVAHEAERAKAALSGISETEKEISASAKQTESDIEKSVKNPLETVKSEIRETTSSIERYDKDFAQVQKGNLAANATLLEGWIE